ncbi:uncharacterized protein LOC122538184, partial [Frieseomelitta varia]|uniref:uncharacterized protein LOC122538184 n=1 Tax=Frieseomelitta varia TaxID=561572 RepID=UPI001CB6A284
MEEKDCDDKYDDVSLVIGSRHRGAAIVHGELSGCYDRSVSDRNQLPDLTYEEITAGEGKGEKEGEFGNESNEDTDTSKTHMELDERREECKTWQEEGKEEQ